MDKKEKKAFSLVARLLSFRHAFRGIRIFLAKTHNAWVEIACGAAAIVLGICFSVSEGEWLAIMLSFGMLLATEALNTAMEIDMDLTSPGYHPYARDTKDIAAGAVLIAVAVFLAVCAIVFLPHIFALFRSGAVSGPRYA